MFSSSFYSYRLTIYVYNVNWKSATLLNGYTDILIYDDSWNLLESKRIYQHGSNYVTFNLQYGYYRVEVYHTPEDALREREFWGGDRIQVNGNLNIAFERHYPIISRFEITSPEDMEYEPGQVIRGKICAYSPWFDDRSYPYDRPSSAIERRVKPYVYFNGKDNLVWSGYSNVIREGEEKCWQFTVTAPNSKKVHIYAGMKTVINGRYVLTDQHNGFELRMKASARVTGGINYLSQREVQPSEKLFVHCTLRNTGNAPAQNLVARLVIRHNYREEIVDSYYIGRLDPGKKKSFYLSWKVPEEVEPGRYKAILRVYGGDDLLVEDSGEFRVVAKSKLKVTLRKDVRPTEDEWFTIALYKDGRKVKSHVVKDGCTFSDLDPGGYQVKVYHKNVFVTEEYVYLPTGVLKELKIRLPDPSELKVCAYYSDGKTPLSGAKVKLIGDWESEYSYYGSCFTGDDGCCSLRVYRTHYGEYYKSLSIYLDGRKVGERRYVKVKDSFEQVTVRTDARPPQVKLSVIIHNNDDDRHEVIVRVDGEDKGRIYLASGESRVLTLRIKPGRHSVEVVWFDKDVGKYLGRSYSKDFKGQEELNFEILRIINRKPVAKIEVSRNEVLTNEAVRFYATKSYDPDGDSLQYYFDFGDGHTTGWVDSPVVKHAYSTPGEYTVKLKVRDDKGAEAEAFVHVSVKEAKSNRKPFVYLTYKAEELNVKFDASLSHDPDGDSLQYYFDFGDGHTTGWVDSPVVKHAYSTPGEYTVKLKVRDDKGLTSGSELTIVVRTNPLTNHAPVAKLTAKSQARIGESVTFDASSSYDPDNDSLQYYFDFGDGQVTGWIDTPVVEHVYSYPSEYTVKLKVRDDKGFTSSREISIKVTAIPKSNIAERVAPLFYYETLYKLKGEPLKVRELIDGIGYLMKKTQDGYLIKYLVILKFQPAYLAGVKFHPADYLLIYVWTDVNGNVKRVLYDSGEIIKHHNSELGPNDLIYYKGVMRPAFYIADFVGFLKPVEQNIQKSKLVEIKPFKLTEEDLYALYSIPAYPEASEGLLLFSERYLDGLGWDILVDRSVISQPDKIELSLSKIEKWHYAIRTEPGARISAWLVSISVDSDGGEEVSVAKLFSSRKVESGYYEIKIKEEDIEKALKKSQKIPSSRVYRPGSGTYLVVTSVKLMRNRVKRMTNSIRINDVVKTLIKSNIKVVADYTSIDYLYAKEILERADVISSVMKKDFGGKEVTIVVGGVKANRFADEYNWPYRVTNELPGRGKGMIEAMIRGNELLILLAGSDHEGTKEAVEAFVRDPHLIKEIVQGDGFITVPDGLREAHIPIKEPPFKDEELKQLVIELHNKLNSRIRGTGLWVITTNYGEDPFSISTVIKRIRNRLRKDLPDQGSPSILVIVNKKPGVSETAIRFFVRWKGSYGYLFLMTDGKRYGAVTDKKSYMALMYATDLATIVESRVRGGLNSSFFVEEREYVRKQRESQVFWLNLMGSASLVETLAKIKLMPILTKSSGVTPSDFIGPLVAAYYDIFGGKKSIEQVEREVKELDTFKKISEYEELSEWTHDGINAMREYIPIFLVSLGEIKRAGLNVKGLSLSTARKVLKAQHDVVKKAISGIVSLFSPDLNDLTVDVYEIVRYLDVLYVATDKLIDLSKKIESHRATVADYQRYLMWLLVYAELMSKYLSLAADGFEDATHFKLETLGIKIPNMVWLVDAAYKMLGGQGLNLTTPRALREMSKHYVNFSDSLSGTIAFDMKVKSYENYYRTAMDLLKRT